MEARIADLEAQLHEAQAQVRKRRLRDRHSIPCFRDCDPNDQFDVLLKLSYSLRRPMLPLSTLSMLAR